MKKIGFLALFILNVIMIPLTGFSAEEFSPMTCQKWSESEEDEIQYEGIKISPLLGTCTLDYFVKYRSVDHEVIIPYAWSNCDYTNQVIEERPSSLYNFSLGHSGSVYSHEGFNKTEGQLLEFARAISEKEIVATAEVKEIDPKVKFWTEKYSYEVNLTRPILFTNKKHFSFGLNECWLQGDFGFNEPPPDSYSK